MAKRKLIVEVKYNKDLAESAFLAAAGQTLDSGTVPKIAGVKFDESFAPAFLPGMAARAPTTVPYVSGEKFDLALDAEQQVDPQKSTYIVRTEVDENKIDNISSAKEVVGVYADVEVQPAIICPGSPALGTDSDVARLLCVNQLKRIGMDGTGIMIAIVDTGINLAHMASAGRPINLDAGRSWVPSSGMVPGNAPVGHGTMCAFDAAIAAPKATFLDVQLLRSSATGPTPMSGVLSDAVRAYSHLIRIMTAPRRPGENRSLVVNNSWAMFHSSWDFPVGHPGNYSDNPAHPFNRIVSALERVGADILFAAGNCGSNCPDGRCQGVTSNTIYGANGHPSVLTIAGVDVTKARVGYSSQGPGRLSHNKPDLCGYTHFKGSGVYAADGGTSAATPVVTGVVAAVRNKRPFSPGNPAVAPAAIRALMRSTALDLGASGFDFDHGFGVVDGCALYKRFRPPIFIDICKRYPWLCYPRPGLDICKRYPQLCRNIQPRPGATPDAADDLDMGALDDIDFGELMEMAWKIGFYDAHHGSGKVDAAPSGSDECCCSENE
jgi:subtilisin family serine protease